MSENIQENQINPVPAALIVLKISPRLNSASHTHWVENKKTTFCIYKISFIDILQA